MRRLLALLAALALAASPAAAAAPRVTVGNGRVLTAPGAAVPALIAAAPLTAGLSAASLPLAPSIGLSAPAALLSAPSAQPALLQPQALEAAPAPAQPPALTLVARRAGGPSSPASLLALEAGAALAARRPADVARLYEAAPAAPDFAALTPVVEPAEPSPWRPSSALLKPAAGLLNAFRRAAYDRRVANAGVGERVTTEELGLRESLSKAHRALEQGLPQRALGTLSDHFGAASAKSWFRANAQFDRYRAQAMSYFRFAESAILRAYGRSHGRAGDAGLVAEARAAAREGSLVGHEYRATPLQDKDSGHCALHTMFNAITASAGFVRPLRVHEFIEDARAALNTMPTVTGSARGVARLERELGVKFGRNVDEGLGDESMAAYARRLGLGLRGAPAPADAQGWLALLRGPEETLLTFRMFHPRFRHDEEERAREGHDYRVLHHAAYLLGAFPSPSRGEWLFMVQDSGSGVTAFHTAEELTALSKDVLRLSVPAAVGLPAPAAAK